MITEDYVSFPISKLLKEKGYKGSFNGYYNNAGCVVDKPNTLLKEPEYQYYERVSLYMAMKWLREDHHIHILPQISDPSQVNPKYYIVIWTTGLKRESYILELFNSYEEAVEEGIKYCLEDLI
jgi:hypothetical protein